MALFEDLDPDELLDDDDVDDEPVLDDFDSFDDEDDEEFSGLRKGWNFVEIFFSRGRLGQKWSSGSFNQCWRKCVKRIERTETERNGIRGRGEHGTH